MSKNNIIIIVIVALVMGGAGFYGGYTFGKSKGSSAANQQRQQAFQQFRNGAGARGIGANGVGGFVSGQIINKDDKSVTVKMRDNSTKIVFYSPTTSISKPAAGQASDLASGVNVTVTGTANSDGTVTASEIQIRPALPANQAPPGQ